MPTPPVGRRPPTPRGVAFVTHSGAAGPLGRLTGVDHASEQRRPDRPIFLYDGDCAFCTSCARFIERRIPTSAEVTPWQFADLDALGVTEADAEASVQWIDAHARRGRPRRAGGPAGIAALLVDAGSYWRPLGWLLDLRPVRWIAAPAYRLIARNRHRLPGGTAACLLPQAERERAKRAGRRREPLWGDGPDGHVASQPIDGGVL
jgi:predicted DCC family thiol-disulfide oxidoreductase YuxK